MKAESTMIHYVELNLWACSYMKQHNTKQTCLCGAASVWPKILNCPSNNYTSLAESDVGAKGSERKRSTSRCAVHLPQVVLGAIHIGRSQNSGIFGPPPSCHCRIHATRQCINTIVCFWPTPSTLDHADVICEYPLGQTRVSFDGAIGSKINGSFLTNSHSTPLYFEEL